MATLSFTWKDLHIAHNFNVYKLKYHSIFKKFYSYFQNHWTNRGPAPFHRLAPNKRFEPVFSTVIMAVCSLFNRMLLLTDLIPVHLLYCGQTVMIGCNHTSFEWTRAVRHIYGIIRHMQGLYYTRLVCTDIWKPFNAEFKYNQKNWIAIFWNKFGPVVCTWHLLERGNNQVTSLLREPSSLQTLSMTYTILTFDLKCEIKYMAYPW